MQNKINQKVPIAKMDELIAAIKESGGGGGKLYRHDISFYETGSDGSYLCHVYCTLYNTDPTIYEGKSYVINALPYKTIAVTGFVNAAAVISMFCSQGTNTITVDYIDTSETEGVSTYTVSDTAIFEDYVTEL